MIFEPVSPDYPGECLLSVMSVTLSIERKLLLPLLTLVLVLITCIRLLVTTMKMTVELPRTAVREMAP